MLTNLSGTTITHFRIEQLLGEGGMGSVYRATDLDLQRPVALKFMHPHLARQEQFQKRFLREARAAAALDHPGIVRVLAYEHVADSLILVMELVSGGNLREYLNQRRDDNRLIPYAVAADLARQVAEALHYAHEQGMYHRDIKPDNLLLKPEPARMGGYRLLISDFGLARMAEMDGLSTTGMPMGTLAYMSPEQAEGEKVDSRTDIYSLGITLYELAAGRPPFQPRSITEAIRLHTREPLPSISDSRPGFPVALEQIISKSTAKDPKDRYQLASELAYALAHFVSSTPSPATLEAPTIMLAPAEPSPPEPTAKPEAVSVAVPLEDRGLSVELRPQWQRGRQGTFVLQLANGGKTPVACRIAAQDPHGMLDCSMRTPQVTLHPGERMAVPIQVTARRRKLLGSEVTGTFEVNVITEPSTRAEQPLMATLAMPVVVPSRLLVLVIAAAAFPLILRSLQVVEIRGLFWWEFVPLIVIGGYALRHLVLELRQQPSVMISVPVPSIEVAPRVLSPPPPVHTVHEPRTTATEHSVDVHVPASPVPSSEPSPLIGVADADNLGTSQSSQQVREQIILHARGSTTLRVDAGAVVPIVLELCNASHLVEHFTFEVKGVPDAWYTVPREPLRLMPDGRDTGQILFHPPPDRQTQPGVYPFEIRAVARTQSLTSVAEQGALHVSVSPLAGQPVVGPVDAAAHGSVLRQDREMVILTLRGSSTVTLEPGNRTTLVLELRNLSDQADLFTLEIDGLPREWYTLPYEPLRLLPGSRDTAQALFHPPLHTRTQAGIHPFALRAVAREQGLRSVAEQAVLHLLAPPVTARPAISELPPTSASIAGGTPAPAPAHYRVAVSIKDSNRIVVDPGGRATLILEVRNLSEQVDDFTLEITGVPKEWYSPPRDVLRLQPNSHDTAHVVFHPPLGKQSLAGAHPIEVRAVARRQGARSPAEQAVLQVAPQRLFIAELRKSQLRGRRGRFALSIENKGNVTAAYRVEVRDQDGRLNLRIEPRQVVLNPSQKRAVSVVASARRPGLFGRPDTHLFDIAVQPEDSGQTVQLLAAELVTPSLLPWWMLGLLLLALAGFAAETTFSMNWPITRVADWGFLPGLVWLVLAVMRVFHGLHLPLLWIGLIILATGGVLAQLGVLYPYYCSDLLLPHACAYRRGGPISIYDPVGLGLAPLLLLLVLEARRFLAWLLRILRLT